MSKAKDALRNKLIPSVVLEVGRLALPESEAGKQTRVHRVLIAASGREFTAVATNGKCLIAVTVHAPYDLPDHAGLYDAVELRKQSSRIGFTVNRDGLDFMDESTYSLANGKKPGKPALHIRPTGEDVKRFPHWKPFIDAGAGEPTGNFNMRLGVILPYLEVMEKVQMFNSSVPGDHYQSPGDVVFSPSINGTGYRLHASTKASIPSDGVMFVRAECVMLGLGINE